jgi:hypothetical protein
VYSNNSLNISTSNAEILLDISFLKVWMITLLFQIQK